MSSAHILPQRTLRGAPVSANVAKKLRWLLLADILLACRTEDRRQKNTISLTVVSNLLHVTSAAAWGNHLRGGFWEYHTSAGSIFFGLVFEPISTVACGGIYRAFGYSSAVAMTTLFGQRVPSTIIRFR